MKILKKNQKNIQKEIGNIFGNQIRSKFSKNIYTNLDSSPNKFGKTENQRFGDSNKKTKRFGDSNKKTIFKIGSFKIEIGL